MFFCVIHEMGHIITALILKMKPEKLEIMPFGLSVSFYTNFNDINSSLKEILVALAGPLTSFIIAIIAYMYNFKYFMKEEIVYSNILILLFNILPIYPLDGGRIIKNILHMKFGAVDSEKIVNKISKITVVIFTVISSIAVYYYKNLAIFLICIFLWMLIARNNSNNSNIYKRKK